MRNYTIPKYPEYDENIRMLENTDPADADSVFNPLLSKMINNTAAIRSKFNGVTIKDMEIINIPNTRDYDYLSLELSGNTRVTPANPELEISPDNVAVIESCGNGGAIKIVSTDGNLLGKGYKDKSNYSGPAPSVDNDGYATYNSSTATNSFLNKRIINKNARNTLIVDIKDVNDVSIGLIFQTGNSPQFIFQSPFAYLKYNQRYKFNLPSSDFFSTAAEMWRIYWDGRDSLSTRSTKIRLMLFPYDADINTPYQEGIVNTYSIPLKDTMGNPLPPLYKIPDLDSTRPGNRNYIRKIDGVWKYFKNVDRITDISGASVSYSASNEGFSGISIQGTPFVRRSNTTLSCNTIPIVNSRKEGLSKTCISIQGYYSWVNVNMMISNTLTGILPADTSDQKIAKFKAWWANSGTYYLRVIPTEEVVELHQDTQTILNNLERTYNDSTIIMGTDEISPLITATYARGSLSTKQINGCEVNDEIIGDRNLLTASKTVELINSMITERLEGNL